MMFKDILVQQKPQFYKPIFEFFRCENQSKTFESEAEKVPSEIFNKKSFIVNKRKTSEPKGDENL